MSGNSDESSETDDAIKFFVFTSCADAVAAESHGEPLPTMREGTHYQVFYAYAGQSMEQLLESIGMSSLAGKAIYCDADVAWLCGSMTYRAVEKRLEKGFVSVGDVFLFDDSSHSEDKFLWLQDLAFPYHQLKLDDPSDDTKDTEASGNSGTALVNNPA